MNGKNQRLDIAVQKKSVSISRSTASKLIEAGRVKINNKVVLKPSFKVSEEDKIIVDDVFKENQEKITIKVIYEDDDVIVIDKPSGLLSHAKGNFNPEATVASWLKPKYTGSDSNRAGIVHRLDRATSGVMIVARNEPSSKWLTKQFSTRKVKKSYIAICSGHLKLKEAIIDLPIERNPKLPQTFRVGSGGRVAETSYKVIKESSKYSLIELKPTTGRTHQLRIHLAYLGHPIVGDSLYDGPKGDRLYLHATSLELTLPNRERKTFVSKLPKEFKILMSDE